MPTGTILRCANCLSTEAVNTRGFWQRSDRTMKKQVNALRDLDLAVGLSTVSTETSLWAVFSRRGRSWICMASQFANPGISHILSRLQLTEAQRVGLARLSNLGVYWTSRNRKISFYMRVYPPPSGSREEGKDKASCSDPFPVERSCGRPLQDDAAAQSTTPSGRIKPWPLIQVFNAA